MRGMNILIVMADQLTPSVLGYEGGSALTPHLDALAARSRCYEAAWCASPLCAPSRFALLSGQRISRIGAWDNAAYLPSTVPTFAHYLRAMGYRTSLAGKMHFVGPDQLHGFEERLTTDIYPADFGWVPDWTRPEARHDLWYHNMSSVTQAGPAAISNQLAFDDEVGAAAMRWLYDAVRRDDPRPFCHVASFTHPHDPYAARPAFWNLYEDREIPPPAVVRPDPADNDPHSLRLERAMARDAVDIAEAEVRRARRAYHANVSYVDAWLGRLLAVLAETGLDERTAILFTADHGDMLGERGLWYKMSPFEPSLRVPLLLALPGDAPGRIETPVSHLDLLPTLLDLAGDAAPPPELIDAPDGQSLLGELAPDRTITAEYAGEGARAPMLMLRRGAHKYVCAPGDPEQLFDLDSDPHERDNLATSTAAGAVLADFRDRADAHWDVRAVETRVLESQRRRRLLTAALEQGARASWDFQPRRDAADEYARSHMDLADFETRARWPRPQPFVPRWR